jgi:hypothetical protein
MLVGSDLSDVGGSGYLALWIVVLRLKDLEVKMA